MVAASIRMRRRGVKGADAGRTRSPARARALSPPGPAAYIVGMARTLVILGLVLVAAGLLWPVLQKSGLGRLPGDIVVERDNFTLYLPVTTSILISLAISLVLWLIGR
jgi:hypothetical protein